MKINDDEISSTISNEIDQQKNSPSNKQLKTSLLKRATSITNRLTDTFTRLTTTNPLMNNYSPDLTHLD